MFTYLGDGAMGTPEDKLPDRAIEELCERYGILWSYEQGVDRAYPCASCTYHSLTVRAWTDADPEGWKLFGEHAYGRFLTALEAVGAAYGGGPAHHLSGARYFLPTESPAEMEEALGDAWRACLAEILNRARTYGSEWEYLNLHADLSWTDGRRMSLPVSRGFESDQPLRTLASELLTLIGPILAAEEFNLTN